MSLPLADRARGCLLGGAVGDALGAPIEFDRLATIRDRFGADGIRDFASAYGRLGAFTDDTQMTLFTAEGLIGARRGGATAWAQAPAAVHDAYLRWLETQGERASAGAERPAGADGGDGLLAVRELHARRAPGHTCLSALRSGRRGAIEAPINDSKGCGGVMRIAPVGLVAGPTEAFRLGAEIAAITHTHPSGYLAAGVLARVVADLVAGETLAEAIVAARDELVDWTDHDEVLSALDAAIELAAEGTPDADRVERLGAGWIAEEALAISVYCALAHYDDFEAAVRLAVNHSGDSDSTGAITGNLVGTILGPAGIPDRWLAELELRETIERLARELAEVTR